MTLNNEKIMNIITELNKMNSHLKMMYLINGFQKIDDINKIEQLNEPSYLETIGNINKVIHAINLFCFQLRILKLTDTVIVVDDCRNMPVDLASFNAIVSNKISELETAWENDKNICKLYLGITLDEEGGSDPDVPNNAIYKNKYGYVLRDVVWYDADKKVYVATDSNGQAISGSGKKISATGRNNEIKIRRHKNGHIDLSVDLSDAEVTNFIHTVNQHQVGDTVSFIQVTDSHYDPFGVIYEQDVPQALPGIGEQNYKMTNAIYNQFIGREGHKDMFKNIGAIAQRFSRKPAFTMHTGDIVDGSPNDPQERLRSFDTVFNYMNSGLNMPNYVTMGNHDLLRGEPEQGYLTSAQRQLPNQALINQKLMSHVQAQGGADIASIDHGYYSIDDNMHKIRYIMLNTHDNQNTTPGQANTQGAITKAQVDWLIQKLQATPDDFHVVFFGHHVLPPAKFVRDGNPNDYTWWIYNLNGDVVADILNAFQHSTSVSVATKQDYVWKPADFVGSWQVDFSGHKPGRVIEMATGHRHNNQQWSADETIYGINTVVEENLAGEWWDNFGTNHSFQFAVHIINLSTGELFIDRFSPTNLVTNQFTKYNFQI